MGVIKEAKIVKTQLPLKSKRYLRGSFRFLNKFGLFNIKARHRRYARYFMIETKGQGKIRQADENAFMSSLAQIITRMKVSKSTRYYFALGLPHTSAKIALRRLSWQVAKKLLLHVFSVNKTGKVTKYSWKDLKKAQQKQKICS